jgi:hypothetical protein
MIPLAQIYLPKFSYEIKIYIHLSPPLLSRALRRARGGGGACDLPVLVKPAEVVYPRREYLEI